MRTTPCDPCALPCVYRLLDYLASIEGRGILTGQHTQSMAQEELHHIEAVTGKRPALLGFELLGYSPNINLEGATEACIAAGADFVKTSTGFNGEGATFEAVQAMLDTAKGRCKVKPSGGIRNYETAKRYIDMGAERLGIGYTSAHAISAGGEVDNSENY